MKKILILGGIVGLIGLLTAFFFSQMNQLNQSLLEDGLDELMLSEVKDGVYHGIYKTNLVSAEVEVQVSNHEIIDIQIIKHDTMFGKDAETIIEEVMLHQSLDVDDVAGATYSSAVIKRAIEDALKG